MPAIAVNATCFREAGPASRTAVVGGRVEAFGSVRILSVGIRVADRGAMEPTAFWIWSVLLPSIPQPDMRPPPQMPAAEVARPEFDGRRAGKGGWRGAITALGASRVAGVAHWDGEQLRLRVLGLPPGSYRVLRGPRCPAEPKLDTLRTGKVDPRERSGSTPEALPFEPVELGRIVVSDRTKSSHELAMQVDSPGPRGMAVMLREDGSARPSLSDAHGLVGCATLRQGQRTTP